MASRNNTNNSRPPQRRSGAPAGRNSGNGSRQGQGNRNSSASRAPRRDYDEDGSSRVLVCVIVAGLAIFLTLCAFGACGSFGDSIASVLFGAFGFTGYIASVFIAGMIFWYMFFGETDELLPIRMTGATVIFLIFGIFADMTGKVSKSLPEYNVGDLFKLCSQSKKGGGVIAGSISYALNKNIGTAGCIIICLLVLILSLFAINRKFFANLFKEIILNASDRTGEFISNQKDRREERRLMLEERDALPELSDNSDRGELIPYEGEEEAPSREALTVTEKMRKERDSKKRDALASVSDGLENWKNNFKKRTEEERLKKEAGKKVKEETEDAKEILVARKAPERRTIFDEKHTGEMHEMSYSEYEPEEGEYTNDAAGTWYDPAKRPGALSAQADESFDEDDFAEEYEEAAPPFERVKVNSDHKIRVTGEHTEEYAGDGNTDIPDMPVAPAFTPDPVPAPESVQSSQAASVSASSQVRKTPVKRNAKFVYRAPSLDFLKKSSSSKRDAQAEIRNVQTKLIETLASFGIEAEMGEYSQGPTVTRYEFTVSQGTKLSRVVGLSDEIKMALAATDIRIEAPIPGKSAIGIEVPNSSATAVFLGDLLSSGEYKKSHDPLSFAVGKDIEGKTVVSNIAKFPHVLIAGTTGSGKSVCINTLILSLLYKCSPEDVQLIMVDPKVVELKVYNKIPHLPFDVVTKPKAASEMLKWSVKEMERRYRAFADRGVRDIEGYNQYVEDVNAGRREPEDVDRHEETESLAPALRKMPRVVIIIDELADLMMVAAKEVEESICRLAQLARAAGMHLIVATQRPSVDVITGLIKANMPSRIAFAVSSGVDSRTILDSVGAEKLLGKGDMLFYPQGKMRPERLQGAFVSDEEVSKVTGYLRGISSDPAFHNPLADAEGINDLKKTIADIESGNESVVSNNSSSSASSASSSVFGDELLPEAGRYIIRSGKASIGYLQRVLKIGFNRAARIMDMLADYSVVGPEQGTKPREILMTEEMFEAFLASQEKSE